MTAPRVVRHQIAALATESRSETLAEIAELKDKLRMLEAHVAEMDRVRAVVGISEAPPLKLVARRHESLDVPGWVNLETEKALQASNG